VDRRTSVWLLIMTFALLSSVALYACVPHIEDDLAAQSSMVLGDLGAPKGWAVVDVDGQQLLLAGEAPGAAERDHVIKRLEAIPGVTDVLNQTVLRVGSNGGEELDSETATSVATDGHVRGPERPVAQDVADGDEDPAPARKGGQIGHSETIPGVPGEDLVAAIETTEGVLQADLSADPAPGPSPNLSPSMAQELPGSLATCQKDVDRLLSGSRTFLGSNISAVAEEPRPVVERIAGILQKCGAAFEVAGHTDDSGGTAANPNLSQARADAIRGALLAHGIHEGRVSAVGYGESEPRVSNATPEGRGLNRPIEIKVQKTTPALAGKENAT